MPPKPRFTREEIVEAALALISRKGSECLSARELGKELGCSAQPIFTVFNDMGELKSAAKEAANKRLAEYTPDFPDDMSAFKQAGMKVIMFAINEQNLFKFLYMTGDKSMTFDELFAEYGGAPNGFVESIARTYGMTAEDARTLFQHAWVFTYGLGMLCATGMCTFSIEDLSKKLTQNFMSMTMLIKSGKLNEAPPAPPMGDELTSSSSRA